MYSYLGNRNWAHRAASSASNIQRRNNHEALGYLVCGELCEVHMLDQVHPKTAKQR